MIIIRRFVKKIICLFKNNKKERPDNLNNDSIINMQNEIYTLPSYMIIDSNEKEKLIYNISLMINNLQEKYLKKTDDEKIELFKILNDRNIINPFELTNEQDLELLTKDLEEEKKKIFSDKYQDIIRKENEFKTNIKEIDKIVQMIKSNDISILVENEIDKEISNVVNDKNIIENIDGRISSFIVKVSEIIHDLDKSFLQEVIREYQKVNYVTISTKMIDKNYERFKKLQDDFKCHRYNRYYYEREIEKLKHELYQIENLKNNEEEIIQIEKLQKELFTKSKDKYDLLYNDEVFMFFNKEFDNLLDKINIKVIDIKKEKNKELKREEKYLDNVVLRYRDLILANKIILSFQNIDFKLINENMDMFINRVFSKDNIVINEKFNYEKNKRKTEFVILFNELNMAISSIKKDTYILINHINFRMEDLQEAVEVKKEELKVILIKNGWKIQ